MTLTSNKESDVDRRYSAVYLNAKWPDHNLLLWTKVAYIEWCDVHTTQVT